MMLPITTIESSADLERCYPVMRELRPGLTFGAFVATYEKAKAADGYALVGVFQNAECIGLMGYRILYDYVHGKHIYIDDLVTTARCRSRGIGAKLLQFAESEAKRTGCSNLRLCTGVGNEDGMKFYEREGWASRAVVYKKKLAAEPSGPF